jgi:hypothetical protein
MQPPFEVFDVSGDTTTTMLKNIVAFYFGLLVETGFPPEVSDVSETTSQKRLRNIRKLK